MKKDHIGLPDSTLKRFRDPGAEDFLYLDLSSKQIRKKGPSTYQRCRGYYQKEFDDVCQRIETLMGDIHKDIDALYQSGGGAFCTNEYLKSIAIDIIALQTARRPELLEKATNPDVILKRIDEVVIKRAMAGELNAATVETAKTLRGLLATPRKRRNYFYLESFEIVRSVIIKEGQMHNYSAIVHAIPEHITATYLLTPYHYFIYRGCYIITLSPRYAIALMPNTAFEALGLREGMAVKVADESHVLKLIPAALEATSSCVQKHLIGERYMLEKIRDYV